MHRFWDACICRENKRERDSLGSSGCVRFLLSKRKASQIWNADKKAPENAAGVCIHFRSYTKSISHSVHRYTLRHIGGVFNEKKQGRSAVFSGTCGTSECQPFWLIQPRQRHCLPLGTARQIYGKMIPARTNLALQKGDDTIEPDILTTVPFRCAIYLTDKMKG